MGKIKIEIPQDRLDLYDKLIAGNPKIDRKGKTVPYTSLNGHMFSFLDKEGKMALRLSKEDRTEFVGKYNTEPVVSYGAVMKEYVQIPIELLQNTKLLNTYLDKSFDYISTLKQKATKK